MQDIMIRIETGDFDAWNQQHYLRAQNRSQYGITDGPAYRDIDNPGAALFHISVADIDTAMQWFRRRCGHTCWRDGRQPPGSA